MVGFWNMIDPWRDAFGRLRRAAAPCKFVLLRTPFAIIYRRHRHGERLDPDVEGAAVSPRSFGIEGITDEDRAYAGSRFSDVREALFANPYQRPWGAPGEPPLPVHPVTLGSLLYGILPFGPPYEFRRATERSVDSAADLRWGPDRKGFRRLVHPNGVCLTGLWQVTADTGYSGYFRNGSRALVVGRYSTCCRETRRGHVRSLSLVGKLFPTVDPDHAAPLRTASFITQEDIGGDTNDYINDVELLNAPNTTALRRGLGMPVLAVFGIMLNVVDKQPTIRQLYQVAELARKGAGRAHARADLHPSHGGAGPA